MQEFLREVLINFQLLLNVSIGKGSGSMSERTSVFAGDMETSTCKPMWGPHGTTIGIMLQNGKIDAETKQ